MSNSSCAELYTTIIDEVILESRQDFENAGIDEQTLQDLGEIWRQKLLAAKVATFAWAPQDDEQDGGGRGDEAGAEAAGPAAAAGGNAGEDAGVPRTEQPDGLGPEQEDTKIKQEETDETYGLLSGPEASSIQNNAMAAQPVSGGTTPAASGFPTSKTNPANTISFTLSNNQLDGSFDFGGARNSNGGDDDDDSDDDDDLGSDLGADSDAINSDLDDSDDEDDEDNNEGGDGEDGEDGAGNDIEQNIMLCLYDRVQRVRNRWKCSLKDGLMNINGKDYVFQKASGDSEW